MEYGKGLWFLMEEVQYLALAFMGSVYVAKVVWLLRKASVRDKAHLKGDPLKGAMVSMGNIFMPWAMESTRVHWFFYIEFMVFHVAVALTILSTFLLPLKLMVPGDGFSQLVVFFMGLAFLVGVRRFVRRISRPEMRMISSMDDYFAIVILNLFFLSGMWALATGSSAGMWVFFVMTTFFLIYVPFSKISHYITYPFARWYYGVNFGGRGVLNKLVKSSD
jgi:nitrate reductase gamma subunit